MKADVTPRMFALRAMVEIASEGASLDTLLPALYESDLSVPDKGFARLLMMTTLRHHGQLGALVEQHLEHPLAANLAPVNWLLRMGAAQLLLLGTPPHAAIDTSVQLSKQLGFVHHSGLVNAILRKISDQKPAFPPASYNLPSWIKGSWRKAYGKEAAEQMAEQCAMEPPLDVMVKPNLPAPAPEGVSFLPNHYRLAGQDVTQLDGYAAGDFWVQDIAASLPVRALGDVSGKRVLDLCAAPGGKTLQLCALGADVIAVDRNERRLELVTANLERCGMQAQLVCADVAHFTPDAACDAVLLDAPCSATGTARRHPDLWLRKQPSDIAEMVALQQAILTQVMTWLPAGVPLIYAVCSLQKEESDEQMEWLLANHSGVTIQPIDGLPAEWLQVNGTVRTLPHYLADTGGMDGFFVAKIMRGV